MIQTDIPGYTYGTDVVPRSPVSLDELQLLQATLLLGEDDKAALRRSGDLLAPQVEAILDVWYGFVGSNPHLLAAFTRSDGQPNQDYLAAVRRRFGRWILDTARAEFNQAWLDYQHEIGVRHTRSGKNRTDGVDAADQVPLRYVLALLIPITTTLKPFLASGGAAPEDVDAMHQAWVKAVLLQVILWSQPYVREGEF
ncbi:MAG TPA: protoglobin domain-containing protein [Propionibacteriaceae bacterium]|nr:protoglobin domain-containing protein [Propionibacteriaceae bacterium]